MIRSFLLIVVLCSVAQAQHVNPTVISQPDDIILQIEDVYYRPMYPPSGNETDTQLCNIADKLTDSNGLFSRTPYYRPMPRDTAISLWKPWGTAVGGYTLWQRLFTARNKPDHSPSNIIAGGHVTSDTDTVSEVRVSKNEDVDFRASGEVRMEDGFHVMPGAEFHAYIEPTWGDSVFSDDFAGSTIDRTQWYVVTNGTNAESGGDQCLFDSNVRITSDAEAIDGKALDLMMREYSDSCSCRNLKYPSFCADFVASPLTYSQSIFSSGMIRACPWPFVNIGTHKPDTLGYQHMPYGKYEIREKIPHFLHHTNNWLYGGADYELDINEGNGGAWPNTTGLTPSLHHRVRYGPFKGKFHDTIFVSGDADWCLSNQPRSLYIDGFAYNVTFALGHQKDSVIGDDPLCWPSSLLGRSDSVKFYYSRLQDNNISDTVTWRIDTDAYGKWRKFSVPYYHMSALGQRLQFSKQYQPSSISLDTDGFGHRKTFSCHWESTLNHPDSGILFLDDYDTLGLHLHSKSEAFEYSGIDEGVFEYYGPPVAFNWNDSSYRYHTFGVEVLPTEIRFLCDSNVVRRIPDRLIPVGNREFDVALQLGRTWMKLYVGQFDMDQEAWADEISTFDAAVAASWRGFDHVTIGTTSYPTAHDLIDYVRVWDVPQDQAIQNFPR